MDDKFFKSIGTIVAVAGSTTNAASNAAPETSPLGPL